MQSWWFLPHLASVVLSVDFAIQVRQYLFLSHIAPSILHFRYEQTLRLILLEFISLAVTISSADMVVSCIRVAILYLNHKWGIYCDQYRQIATS